MEINIYYADTDCGGVVYYANYLKYFEYGRTEYMRRRGLDPSELSKQGIMFTVVTAELVYHAPARYGDTLIIDTFVIETSRASFTFGYKVQNKKTGQLLTEGKTKIVTVDGQMKVRKLDDGFATRLKTST